MARWYEAAGAVVVAVAVTAAAGVATAHTSPPTRGERSGPVDAVAAAPGPPALGPVTVHPLAYAPPPVRASATATQVVRVQVIGGDLTLSTDHVSVPLAPSDDDGVWTGLLPPVRVIDARGTLAGWRVRWTVSSVETTGAGGSPVPAGVVGVEAGDPIVVAGVADGLRAGNGHVLFSAHPGAGAGTYEAGGTVTLRLPRPWAPESVVVHLTFELG